MKTCVSLLLVTGALGAASLPELIATIEREVRPEDAMKRMREIWSTDRYFTFPKFAETSRNVHSMLRNAGAEAVEIIDTPADGKTRYGFWTMPLAWDVNSATLERLGEAGETLADYSRIPASLCMWSGPTPPAGIEAELVEYKRGADVRGKFVLTRVNPAGIKHELVRAGVAGVVNAFSENPDLRDGRQWVNAWGDHGWGYIATSTPLPCFSISPAQAARLRLPVRVRARVASRYYSGSYPYVTGVIRGSSREEVLMLGHAFEQGAQDNATGVAAMIEAVAALQRLMRSNAVSRPKRTIRVLVMGEYYGTHHYIAANPERVRRTIGAFCLDTPAAPYELKGTEYTFHLNPHSGAAYTDALIQEIAQAYFPRRGRPFRTAPFRPGTDSFLGEPSIGIPTTWPYSGTGVHTHHNSDDTPDRVDARSLRDLTVVAATYLYYLANAGEAEARFLEERIRAGFDGTRRDIALASLRRLKGEGIPRATPPASGAPRRLRFGTIPLDDLPAGEREGFPSGAWALAPALALYWADGYRPVSEIARLTEEEAGKHELDILGYFRFLARKGYIAFPE
jgi:hypothetical protein